MDLNIGTAFWFASRGSGYLLPHSSINSSEGDASIVTKDVDEIYDINDITTGRPLLRRGPEGARKGDGRDQKCATSAVGYLLILRHFI